MARERQAGLFDQVIDGFRSAVDDIRTKLIDEGWFGRRAAPPSQFESADLGWVREPAPNPSRSADEIDARPSFEEMWATREPGREPGARDQELDLER